MTYETDTDGEEFDRREQVIETERGFSIDINHKRGTEVRDEDTVSVSWQMERKPPQAALTDLTADVKATMESLRGEEEPDDG